MVTITVVAKNNKGREALMRLYKDTKSARGVMISKITDYRLVIRLTGMLNIASKMKLDVLIPSYEKLIHEEMAKAGGNKKDYEVKIKA